MFGLCVTHRTYVIVIRVNVIRRQRPFARVPPPFSEFSAYLLPNIFACDNARLSLQKKIKEKVESSGRIVCATLARKLAPLLERAYMYYHLVVPTRLLNCVFKLAESV